MTNEETVPTNQNDVPPPPKVTKLPGDPLPKLAFAQQSENSTFRLSRSPVDLAAEGLSGGDDVLRDTRQSGWVTRDI